MHTRGVTSTPLSCSGTLRVSSPLYRHAYPWCHVNPITLQWYPESILSIDLGKVNAAYALVDQRYRVQGWSMLDLTLPTPYSPRDCYENVSAT